jgi:hypothetical protein
MFLAVGSIAMLAVSACAGEPPRATHPMHPLDEAHAADVIARTMHEAGIESVRDRFVRVGRDESKKLHLEVSAVSRKLAVAYLTPEDWVAAGDGLPPRAKDDALVVATVEGGMRVLLLWADDYLQDDMTGGEDHTTTTFAADRRLRRDVLDFVHRAETQGW